MRPPYRLFAATFWASGLGLLLHSCSLLAAARTSPVPAQPLEQQQRQSAVFLTNNIDRPLRYTPEGADFVITNGAEFFNRPLYGGNSAFRVDGGDKPEFSLYQPGRGGNLRLGIKTAAGVRWFNDAGQIVTRYRPGSLVYDVRDPLLGASLVRLTAIGMRLAEGLIVRAELFGAPNATELVWAFGGVDGMRGGRDGDIGCEREPVSRFFQLRASQCVSNVASITGNSFRVQGKGGVVAGAASGGVKMFIASASNWNRPDALLSTPEATAKEPVLAGSGALRPGEPVHLALQRVTSGDRPITTADLPRLFDSEEIQRRIVAERVVVETPDPFINAAAAALNIAADAVWDEKQQAFMHGAVAWRVRLLGWRGAYAGDTLGWHERTAAHFAGFANKQNTNAIPARLPTADEDTNLARSEAALHSNGDLTKSHYDMNLAGVDVFFRHLLWTGDLDYARRMWPVIERHLAWERRLFRREFGPDRLPLYEAYSCIWASDDVAYNGAGVTHASAYNYWHNRMAARVARLIGKDPLPYEREAGLIAEGLRRELWLNDRGWFAESKDLLGLQLVHPNAAAWTFYHTLDCEVPTPMEAWQMTRFVDTQLARIPLRGPGVPEGSYTVPTTSWMPYSWSVNNVVLAEVMHTALAFWQAGRTDGAFPLFKGAVLDSMFLGLCPGNVGMCTYFDTYRRESQRDFADGVGAMSRALVEGLFGVQPDALAGELRIRPGFPPQWKSAAIRHPDFSFGFRREDLEEVFTVEQKRAQPMALRLQVIAARDQVAGITVNGAPAKWTLIPDAVGSPRIEIQAPAESRQRVAIQWSGRALDGRMKFPASLPKNGNLKAVPEAAELFGVQDPQGALSDLAVRRDSVSGRATGTPGHRTVFAQLRQGTMRWWQPVPFEIRGEEHPSGVVDWRQSLPASALMEMIDLTPLFNAKASDIFRNEYRSPRSPFCSLAAPKQGIGAWCHPQDQFDVDDSGLRAAAKAGDRIILPNGVPLATPGASDAKNIVFVSQWDNYPHDATVPLTGKASRAFLLLAGSTSAMQSQFDNGEVIAHYTDGMTSRLALHNPTTWWPIDQDYYVDDFAFARPGPLPVRVDLKTGKVRVLEMDTFKGQGRKIPGGAATVLVLPLDASKELKSLTVRALANEVVIGLMSVTLIR